MLYNKYQINKTNDKKVLHKIRKQWITISIALFALIGVDALASHTDISANSNINNDSSTQSMADNINHSNNRLNINQYTGTQNINNNGFAQNVQQKTNRIRNHILNTTANVSQKFNKYAVNNTNSYNVNQNTYLHNNEAYNDKSFTNVDGFLTANSWYRPKMIHQNGTTWRPSQQSNSNDYHDYRPILMDWWPDKNTQVKYLNYMQQHGLISNSYNLSDNQDDLNQAAHDVQDNLEHNIYLNNNYLTQDVKPLFADFVSTQPQWNIKSEDYKPDSLQGGYLAFMNNSLTPNTDTPYRYIGRNGSYRHQNNNNFLEYLLGNDIDNSNPKVQAEDLNFLYYLNNLGTILKNDPNSNFDGMREDATFSMDYDVTNIFEKFLDDEYHMNKNDATADNHLNILEDGPYNSAKLVSQDGNDVLTQDEDFLSTSHNTLLNVNHSGNLANFLNYNGIDRADDYTYNQAVPNYSRINAHDGDEFTDIYSNIMPKLLKENPHISITNALAEANHIYNTGEYESVKPDGQQYNLPADYALLLTNKDTVPQIYYGDIYRTDKPYMSTPSPYFSAIETLAKARKKYVSGGQQMRVHGDILSSVRFGKGALTPTDLGSSKDDTRTSGICVIIGNNPHANPANNISVYMGAAHKNEQYKPLMISAGNGNDKGFDYSSSERLTTDANGNLMIPAKDLQGVINPQASGNMSVWVPVGASVNQDSRTLPSTVPSTDGKAYHSNAALDSHLLYESFSSLQPLNAPKKQQLDYVISQPNSINTLNRLGITDFRFPPHYMPVKNDTSFADATDQNGYAFEDRYNQGMNGQSTKYGTVEDLLNANRQLHKVGIHTLGDYVANQLYDFPLQQVVPVMRASYTGAYDNNSKIYNHLYLDNSMSSKNDYQYKYGGAFLTSLKNNPKYHDLFTTNQVSTNQPIDTSKLIKQWSAKYENGSNLQNHGIDNVLNNYMGQYYNVNGAVPEIFTNNASTEILPTAVVINYKYKNRSFTPTLLTGIGKINLANLHLPKGFTLTQSTPEFNYDGKIHNIQITPYIATDSMHYVCSGKIVGTSNFNGNAWSSYEGKIAFQLGKHPKGLASNYQVQDPNHWYAYDGNIHNVNVAQIPQATDIINYQYNGKTISSHRFTGNAWSTGANNIAFQIGRNPLGLQSNYKVVDPNRWIAYDSDTHDVNVIPTIAQATNTINYQYNGKTIGSHQFTGNAWSTGANDIAFQLGSTPSGLPNNYKIIDPSHWIAYDGGTYNVDVTPVPIPQATDTIDYRYNGRIVGIRKFTGNAWSTRANNIAFQLGSNPSGLSNSYKVVNPNHWIAYDGKTHDVNVMLTTQAMDTINYRYNGEIIGSQHFIGNAWDTGANNIAFQLGINPSGLLNNYRVVNPTHWIAYDGNTHNVNVVPIPQIADIINYRYKGKIIGSQQFIGNAWDTGTNNIAFQLGSNPSGLQDHYKVVDPKQWIAYDGNIHNVNVRLI